MITRAMWEKQKAFLASQMSKYPDDQKLLHLVFCTHLAHEVHELMDCVPWKFHRAQPPALRSELLEEAVDVAKLWMNVLSLHGVTPEEFSLAFYEKSAEVERRCNDA